MNRSLKLSLLCTGIFLCGAVAGSLVCHRLAPGKPARGDRDRGGGDESLGPNMLRRLTGELELTEAQRAAIDPAIQKSSEALRTLRRESFRQSATIVEEMEAAVAAQLTPAQAEKFNALKEQQRERMKAMWEERQRRRAAEAGAQRPPGEGPPPPPPES